MPKYVDGVELTQEGMHAIFDRMGYGKIISGSIYNGVPTIDQNALNQQGFMPVLTGVGPNRDSGHWIMLIKRPGNQYFLFDPLGRSSGEGYQNTLAAQLPNGSTLSVIPNNSGLNMGLCGYWVASVGLRAHQALNQHNPPSLMNLGQTITDEMRNELDNDGYRQITGWLRAVAEQFPEGDPQLDGKALRETTEKDLKIEIPALILPGKNGSPKEVSVKPTGSRDNSVPVWNGFSLYTNDAVRTAVQYAYDNYLGKPYTGTVEVAPANFNGKMVHRQHHGLSHTLRTMAYAEVIVDEARKAKLRGETLVKFKDGRTIADVTPEELKKIMIAQAFFVAGRDDEASDPKSYRKYHDQSRDAFLKYVKDNESTLIPDVFKDQEDVNLYALVIEDKDKDWDSTPVHALINQSHMVDLLRLKQPPESFLQFYFSTMKWWIGSQAAEAVLGIQRQFFHATYEVVTGFDADNKEPHLIVRGSKRYVIGEDGQPIKEDDPVEKQKFGELKMFPQTYKLKENERFMRVDEFLNLPQIQSTFPGFGKQLQGGIPGMNDMDYWNRLNSTNRALCENDVDFCLQQLQKAHDNAKINPLKVAFQSSKETQRRAANMDEIAAARIIQHILAHPDCIHDDHVSINGQKLEERFFRDLLAKCEMAVVGSLLDDADIRNIDTLMHHEKNTEFHATGAEAVPKKIGEFWINDQNRNNRNNSISQKKHDLVFLMQNDAWYFSRVNAIAQNRDRGSSFKEVLITTLMTPLTSKALVDTMSQKIQAPKRLVRGLNLPEEFTKGLIAQANAMIANTTERLFTDYSPEAFKQIKLNDLSKMSRNTNLSTTTDINLVTQTWDSNVIFEMLDPDGLLHPKQVGSHEQAGTESEFSVYLPEDVALLPVKVMLDGKTQTGEDRYVFTFIAVKSPDFIPLHEVGYAFDPFLRMQTAKLVELRSLLEKIPEAPHDKIIDFQNDIGVVQFSQLPRDYKDFLQNTVGPVLEKCFSILFEADPVALSKILATFPSDAQWSGFNFEEAIQAKIQMDALKKMLENKVVFDLLSQCQDALEKQNIAGALDVLKKIPSEKEISSISRELREQVLRIKQNIDSLQRAVVTPIVTDENKVKERYDALIEKTTKKITALEIAKIPNIEAIREVISNLSNLRQDVTVLRNEKIRAHSGSDKVDFSDIEKLEKQIQVIDNKLSDAYLLEVSKHVSALVNEKPKNQSELKTKIAKVLERAADIEILRQERSKKELLDMSDLDKLSSNLLSINQSLVSALTNTIRVSINQMDMKTFHIQEKEIQQNFELLVTLEKTLGPLDVSEKLRKDISNLNDLLVAKQKIYPQMVQLQLKSEVFITQLRELCQANYKNHEKTINDLDRQELDAGTVQMVGNIPGLSHDERVALKLKQQVLAQFKADLFNDQIDTEQLIMNLTQKTSIEVMEGFGVSPDNADQLYVTLMMLGDTNRPIEDKMKAIDDISIKIGRKPESLKVEQEQEESNKNMMGF